MWLKQFLVKDNSNNSTRKVFFECIQMSAFFNKKKKHLLRFSNFPFSPHHPEIKVFRVVLKDLKGFS